MLAMTSIIALRVIFVLAVCLLGRSCSSLMVSVIRSISSAKRRLYRSFPPTEMTVWWSWKVLIPDQIHTAYLIPYKFGRSAFFDYGRDVCLFSSFWHLTADSKQKKKCSKWTSPETGGEETRVRDREEDGHWESLSKVIGQTEGSGVVRVTDVEVNLPPPANNMVIVLLVVQITVSVVNFSYRAFCLFSLPPSFTRFSLFSPAFLN